MMDQDSANKIKVFSFINDAPKFYLPRKTNTYNDA